MESTTKKGIFIGYSETSKESKVYTLAIQKIVVMRDVKFEEEKDFLKSYDVLVIVDQSYQQATPKEEQEFWAHSTSIDISTGIGVGTCSRVKE